MNISPQLNSKWEPHEVNSQLTELVKTSTVCLRLITKSVAVRSTSDHPKNCREDTVKSHGRDSSSSVGEGQGAVWCQTQCVCPWEPWHGVEVGMLFLALCPPFESWCPLVPLFQRSVLVNEFEPSLG